LFERRCAETNSRGVDLEGLGCSRAIIEEWRNPTVERAKAHCSAQARSVNIQNELPWLIGVVAPTGCLNFPPVFQANAGINHSTVTRETAHFGESPTIEGDRVRRKTYLATSSVINGYGTMK
jgi:hypothetical protein